MATKFTFIVRVRLYFEHIIAENEYQALDIAEAHCHSLTRGHDAIADGVGSDIIIKHPATLLTAKKAAVR